MGQPARQAVCHRRGKGRGRGGGLSLFDSCCLGDTRPSCCHDRRTPTRAGPPHSPPPRVSRICLTGLQAAPGQLAGDRGGYLGAQAGWLLQLPGTLAPHTGACPEGLGRGRRVVEAQACGWQLRLGRVPWVCAIMQAASLALGERPGTWHILPAGALAGAGVNEDVPRQSAHGCPLWQMRKLMRSCPFTQPPPRAPAAREWLSAGEVAREMHTCTHLAATATPACYTCPAPSSSPSPPSPRPPLLQLGLNEFADLSPEEFAATRLGLNFDEAAKVARCARGDADARI